MAFSEHLHFFRPSLLAVDADVQADLEGWLAAERPEGGADFGLLMEHANSLAAPPGLWMQWVLVTDSRPPPNDAPSAWERARDRPLYTVGIGLDVDAPYLQHLADTTGGLCELLPPRQRVGQVLQQFVMHIGRVWLRHPEMDLSALAPLHVSATTAALPDLYRGRSVVLAGRYRASGTHDVALRGREGPLVREHHAVVRAAARGHTRPFGQGLERLLAWRRAAHLVKALGDADGAEEARVGELVALGAELGALTEYTLSLADGDAVLPGQAKTHFGLATDLVRKWLPLRSGAMGWAQAAANGSRLRSLRAPTGPLELLVGARGDRDVMRLPVPGVRHSGPRTLFQRRDEGWVEGRVAQSAEAETLRPGTPAFEAWLARTPRAHLGCLALEGDVLLSEGDDVLRIARMR